jgi:hypothetical protein
MSASKDVTPNKKGKIKDDSPAMRNLLVLLKAKRTYADVALKRGPIRMLDQRITLNWGKEKTISRSMRLAGSRPEASHE